MPLYLPPPDSLTPFHLASAASTNPTSIKATSGKIYGWFIYNNNSNIRKVAFHDTSSAPVAGSGVYFTLPIPPNSGANILGSSGIIFNNGIALTTVTGISDVDSSAVGLNDLNINLWYK
jgi:hypothetical protein